MVRRDLVFPAEDAEIELGTDVKKRTQSSSSTKSNWILIDASGHSTILDADKNAIMRLTQIDARDLRVLDPLLFYPSTILGREAAIVLNLEHIKAIITCKEILLRDPLDENVIPVVEELQRRLPPPNIDLPCQETDQNDVEADENNEIVTFEFRALDIALEAICSFLSTRTTEMETVAYPILDELTSKVSSRNLDRVRQLKNAMTSLTTRVQKIRDELEQILKDDADMADLYLSRKSGENPIQGDENEVDELEMLLEAYFMQIDTTCNKLTTLREYIDDTEDYINIQLDNHRNQLIQLDLFLSSTNVSLSIFSCVAGIFGVLFPYEWNKGYGYMLKWVLLVTGACCLLVLMIITGYARYKRLVGS